MDAIVKLWQHTDMEYITADQAAEKLQMTSRTIRRFLAQGKLPGTRVGTRHWRISEAALREFMERSSVPEKKPAVPKDDV